jgi:hypothetical protein
MPASHFDVKPMTGRPKFIVRHSSRNDKIILSFEIYHPKNNVHNQDGNHDANKVRIIKSFQEFDVTTLFTNLLYRRSSPSPICQF